ncbi:hypothetical protein [Cryobacterium sp. BB736]|uniref:hypothetical protein n=1 Tax=Cryobacterium sp. BB736 TaxID=2746963 RepID=UPI0018739E8F|nr:hypothetical protein [Cryobacterium sp. BB736]
MDAPAAPELTEVTSPSPGVEVYFPFLHGDGATITVWRVADGVREEVRGAKRASVAGDFPIIDFEVPFGVAVTYVGELFDAAGASVLGEQASIQVDVDEVWFQSQVDPELAFPVRLEAASFSTVTRPRNTKRVFVAGVSRPFEQHWGLGAIEGLPFTVFTDTGEQADAMQRVLESSPLLIRTPPRFRTLPRLLSASIAQPSHNPLDWQYNGDAIVWTLTVDEVQPVSKAILRPLVTWDDWTEASPEEEYEWNEVIAIYGAGTWTDAQRNPPTV